jgi:hypothetical protein
MSEIWMSTPKPEIADTQMVEPLTNCIPETLPATNPAIRKQTGQEDAQFALPMPKEESRCLSYQKLHVLVNKYL